MSSVADYYDSLRRSDLKFHQMVQDSNREALEFANRMVASRRNAELSELSRKAQEESWATIERIRRGDRE